MSKVFAVGQIWYLPTAVYVSRKELVTKSQHHILESHYIKSDLRPVWSLCYKYNRNMTPNPHESGTPHLLRRTKARIPVSSCDGMIVPSVPMRTERGIERILRVFLGNPWNDHVFVRNIGYNIIARQKDPYFKLMNIRPCHRENILKQSCLISSFEHPNIATLYAIYCAGEEELQSILISVLHN